MFYIEECPVCAWQSMAYAVTEETRPTMVRCEVGCTETLDRATDITFHGWLCVYDDDDDDV